MKAESRTEVFSILAAVCMTGAIGGWILPILIKTQQKYEEQQFDNPMTDSNSQNDADQPDDYY
ncbi:hypothetical protein VF14_20740 [Nostoc linckia z18]|uniref:Uncharacterized protein n=2 Tax=Nostoc linckia TaxID=92942 RepID=A0A9Q5ZAJ2_NOSLI|nr:hypothetical protein [Nostoc linckia]PHK32447.1 hypothetical protein VF14_20740 [Nostoc linckia z18]PHK40817.1 hypothetical protein VF12_09125 [Nostoc linckia z15]PHK44766.1 hypothetical protein VF13_20195 [Nostoc linckia z16]PHJ57643.1 hypothetical protein VF02_29865 [Nostoc linckia z1]PHJ59877.1 hypothetical protein VF05_31550 [Nostoc linckia z3]